MDLLAARRLRISQRILCALAGLEAATQFGLVGDGESFEDFLRVALRQMHRGIGRFVREARDAPADFARLDAECDLFLNNHVANRASRAQGGAFLVSAGNTFGNEPLEQLATQAREQRMAVHLAVVFGIVCRRLGIDQAETSELFRFTTARGLISAAVRMGIIGPMAGQQIQARFSAAMVSSPNDDAPVQIAPMLDLLHGNHDRLYSRLFQS